MLRIEVVVATKPFDFLLMLRMIWRFEDLEEFPKRRGTSAVFGRTCSLTGKTSWNHGIGIDIRHLLDGNRVLPAITKVVLVQEG